MVNMYLNITRIDPSYQYVTHFLKDCQNQLNIKTEHRRIDLHLQLSLTSRIAIFDLGFYLQYSSKKHIGYFKASSLFSNPK